MVSITVDKRGHLGYFVKQYTQMIITAIKKIKFRKFGKNWCSSFRGADEKYSVK